MKVYLMQSENNNEMEDSRKGKRSSARSIATGVKKGQSVRTFLAERR
jgi:hypothetical protein